MEKQNNAASRLIAISIVILSGALMSSAGEIAQHLAVNRIYRGFGQGFGVAIVSCGIIALCIELYFKRSS